MMRKKIIILFLVIITGIYVFMHFFVWYGKTILGYYKDKQAGRYNTQREFSYSRQGEASWIASLNDRFFYRDYETNGMKEVVFESGAYMDKIGDSGIYANSKYVYIESTNKITQYTGDGEKISVKEFPPNNYIKSIYCGEKYVYALTVNNSKEADFKYSLWILEAGQVEKTVDIGEPREEKAIGAFVKVDDTVIGHKVFETSKINLYYCGKIERKDSEKGIVYQIKENDVDEESEFEPVIVNKSVGNRVSTSNVDLTTENLLAVYDDQIYSWNDGMVEFTPEWLKLYRTDSKGNTEIEYESKKYKPIYAHVSGPILIILGEDFYKMPMEEGGAPYLTGEYRGAVLLYYDMSKQKIVREYKFENEQIVYMNDNNYATLKDGIVYYYEVNDNKLLWVKKIPDYETSESDEVSWYYFEACNDRLFVFRENDAKLMCEFELDNMKNP